MRLYQRRTENGKAFTSVTVGVDPKMGMDIDVWASRAGVTRSELGRYVWSEALRKFERMGRYKLRQKILEGRESTSARGASGATEELALVSATKPVERKA